MFASSSSPSSTSGFRFGGSSTAPPTSGFRFGGASTSTTSAGGRFVFDPTATTATKPAFTPSNDSGFSWSNPRSSGSLFGPPTGRAGAFGFGVEATADPLARGLSTRACFAANDDQRFTRPAFQASKPSSWAAIKAMTASATASVARAPKTPTWFGGGSQAATSVPTWGTQATTYAPTSIVEPSGQTAQLMSISGMPTHADESVEELRLATRRKTNPFFVAPRTASSGFTFGMDRNASNPVRPTTTTFGLPKATTDAVDSGNPFTGFKPAVKPTHPVFGFGASTDSSSTSAKPAAGSGGFLFRSDPSTHKGPSASLVGVVPSGGSSTASTSTSSAVSDGDSLFAPRAPGTYTPMFGPPSAAPPTPSLFWKPPTEAAAPLPAPKPGFLFGSASSEPSNVWASTSPSSLPEEAPRFSFVKDHERVTTSSVRFGSDGDGIVSASSGVVDAAPITPNESGPVEHEPVPTTEATSSTVAAEGEPGSLALPRLTQSYSAVSGSRASAFVRRAGAVGRKSFGARSAHLAVAAMTSSRKCSHSQALSPAKRSVERIVVGRRDGELWKRSDVHLKSSIFASSASVAASEFATEMTPSSKDAVGPTVDTPKETTTVEHESETVVPTTETSGSLDRDNYDL